MAFACRQRRAALADDGSGAARQRGDEPIESRGASGVLDLGVRRVGPRVADVVRDRRVEDERFLINQHDVAPHISQREAAQIVSVETDRSFAGIDEAQ